MCVTILLFRPANVFCKELNGTYLGVILSFATIQLYSYSIKTAITVWKSVGLLCSSKTLFTKTEGGL